MQQLMLLTKRSWNSTLQYLLLTAMPATLRRGADGSEQIMPFSELPPEEQPVVDYLGMVSGHLEFLRRNPGYAQQDPPEQREHVLKVLLDHQGEAQPLHVQG